MNNDLISRSKVEAVISALVHEEGVTDDAAVLGCMVWNAVSTMKAVDAAPVVHGNNVTPTHPADMFMCSECGFVCEITKLVYEDEDYPEVGIPKAYEYECKFCLDCGAKLDKEDT